MNLLVIVPLVAIMAILQWRKVGMLTWLIAWWLGIFCFFSFGFTVPIPQSVISLYMGIITLSLVVYVTSDPQRIKSVLDPLTAFMTQKRYFLPLILVMVAIPTLSAARIYLDATAPVQAPFFARTVHPATPATIAVHDQEYDMATLDNPYRELESSDPAEFSKHLANGRRVYYQNCFYCHGDHMAGDGIYARGLNPIPTNFQDTGTIAILQESYLFWRIAKGAPGLPEEGGPWESAMPVWEQFLTDEEIWDVVLYLYEYTGQRPRAREEVH